MNALRAKAPKQTGFTIVELLIVIVVIAILAAITIIAYNGIQARARDSIRKHDVAEIGKLFQLYNVDNSPMATGSGCGATGDGRGWFSGAYTGYTKISDCLINAGVTTQTIVDPSGNKSGCATGDLTCESYMVYTCSQSGVMNTYVYAHLETMPQTDTDTDGTCVANWDTSYGMNYYVKVSA